MQCNYIIMSIQYICHKDGDITLKVLKFDGISKGICTFHFQLLLAPRRLGGKVVVFA